MGPIETIDEAKKRVTGRVKTLLTEFGDLNKTIDKIAAENAEAVAALYEEADEFMRKVTTGLHNSHAGDSWQQDEKAVEGVKKALKDFLLNRMNSPEYAGLKPMADATLRMDEIGFAMTPTPGVLIAIHGEAAELEKELIRISILEGATSPERNPAARGMGLPPTPTILN
jgi:hypothetical protein